MKVMEDSHRRKIALGEDGNALVQLVAVNAVLFIILKFIFIIYLVNARNPVAYETNVLNWFVLPGTVDKLSSRPWTVLLYMFSDPHVVRFLGNMFWLWCF